MIATADIKAKIKTDLTPNILRSVGGTAELLAAIDQLKASPSAFVMPAANRAGGNTAAASVVRQRITQQFSVIFGFTNAGATGETRINDIEIIEAALIETLVGWQPPNAANVLEYVGGKVISFDADKQVIFWGSDFVCPAYVRST